MNIDVLARIRPPQRGEGAHNLNVQGGKISQTETNTAHTFDTTFDDDCRNESIYTQSVVNMLDLLVAGYNCSLLSIGESGSGKSFSLLGDRKSHRGLVHMAIGGMFDKVNSVIESDYSSSRAGGRMTYNMSLNMFEVCNEVVRDLLKTGGNPSDISITAKDWIHVKDLTSTVLRTESDAVSELSRGWDERTQTSTDYGPTQARATLFIRVNLTMEKDEFGFPHESSFLFMELPGLEKLSSDQQELRKREGALQNKALVSFNQIISELSTRSQPDRVINYSESKVTSLLESAVGGNCKTKAIMHFNPRPNPTSLKTSLTMADKLSRVQNFFIINDYAGTGLLTQYHARIISLQGQVGIPQGPAMTREDSSADQAKLARENLKMKEENDYLRRRLDQIQSRFGDIASAKTDLSSRLINSEEEKLKMSKLLVDLRIENNKLKERGAQDNFEQKNKILALENRLVQVESERDRLLRDFRQMRDHFDQIQHERQNVGDRYVDLNADYKSLAKKYEGEIARNQQLGLELLNLLNAEVTLLKQRDNLGRVGGASHGGSLAGSSEDLARVRDIALGLSAERQKVSASDSDKLEVRQKLFGNQERFRGEVERMKSHYDQEQDKLQGIINKLNSDLQDMRDVERETKHRLTEAEVELLMLRGKSKDLQSANSKLQLQMKEKNEEVRTRLVKYLQDVADHIDKYQKTGGRGTPRDKLQNQMEAMMKDLKQTYRNRETQLSDAAREYKHTAEDVTKKHRQLLVEYRYLRRQVIEKTPSGIDPGPEEHELTIDKEGVESADRRELTRVMKQLKETENELIKLRREGSCGDRWRSLKDEFLKTQKELESERAKLLANNSVLEEQLNEYQDYIHTHVNRYQDEIRRLRRQLGLDDRLELLGLTDDFGVSRWTRDARPSQIPPSLRKYRTLPEI